MKTLEILKFPLMNSTKFSAKIANKSLVKANKSPKVFT